MRPSMAILIAGDKMFISADVDDTQNEKAKVVTFKFLSRKD